MESSIQLLSVQCYVKLDQMFVCMRNTNHVCKYRVVHHGQSRGVHRPLPPAELVEACGTLSECVECLALRQDFLKVSLLSTTSAHSVQSFAVLCFLVSVFAISVASVLWEWKLLAFSTRLRTCFMASVAPVIAPHLHQDCVDFLPFLFLVDLPYWT